MGEEGVCVRCVGGCGCGCLCEVWVHRCVGVGVGAQVCGCGCGCVSMFVSYRVIVWISELFLPLLPCPTPL